MTRQPSRLRRVWSHVWDWLVIAGLDLLATLVIMGVVLWVSVAHWIN